MNEDLAGELSQQNPLIKFLVTSIEELKQGLKALDEKVEARLHDTRPLWERIVGEIDKLRLGQEEMRVELTELRTGQTSIREELVKINYHLKLIDGKLKSAFGEIGDLRADFTVKMAEVENRLPKLEHP
jgi:chromosome segregation ATPase